MKLKKNWIEASVLGIVTVGFLLALGCSPPGGNSSSGSEDPGIPDPTPTPTPTVDVTTLSPLTFEVSTSYDGAPSPTFEVAKLCEVSASAARGSSDTCTLSIEEGRLFHSSVKFTIATNRPDRCRMIHFMPYYYYRSSSNAYIPPGETDAPPCDENELKRNPKCWGGAAPFLVDGFPVNRGITATTFFQSRIERTMESEWITSHYGGQRVNYAITNDLVDRATAILTEPRYYQGGNRFQDYMAYCEDEWGFLYHSLRVIISDEDYDGSDSHPEDEYDDWQ